jgi:hypothetical protein
MLRKIVLVAGRLPILFLASGTVVAAAAGDHDALDGSLANQTWLPFPSVNAVLQLKESFLAIGIHVV